MATVKEMARFSPSAQAVTAWTAEDIKAAALQRGWTITEEQAQEWLDGHEDQLQDRLIQLGWELIDTLLDEDGFNAL